MRKYLSFALVLLLTFTLFRPVTARAEIPAKAKAFLTITGYGAGGGALLGLASMAFGTSSRAVFQGASLGLYAGILFGTYVLVSHHQRRTGTYDDTSSPYSQESSDVYGDEYKSDEGGADKNEEPGGFFERHNQYGGFQLNAKGGNQIPPIHVNFFQYNF